MDAFVPWGICVAPACRNARSEHRDMSLDMKHGQWMNVNDALVRILRWDSTSLLSVDDAAPEQVTM